MYISAGQEWKARKRVEGEKMRMGKKETAIKGLASRAHEVYTGNRLINITITSMADQAEKCS
jgi:hypothetical protein